jgi:3-oxoacyl-(acyl-carrier-protein) synthase/thioesterase domain-containing protein/acyl carrier protein
MRDESADSAINGAAAEDIAVIGMAGRFPGAADVDELWRNLRAGVVSLRRFTPDELAAAGVPAQVAGQPHYVPAGTDLAGVEDFDAGFFDLPAHEARLTDPQHRLFLETVWRALEQAGYDPGAFAGRIGVFGATTMSTYVSSSGLLTAEGVDYPLLLGNDKDFLCSRVSYKLGLRGPSMAVQTACSGSLVAVHLATAALLAGECELAVAGGVSITLPQHAGYVHREGGILSPDGLCRVFDAAAAGTVKGNGCAVVVLRPLDDARAAHDTIHGVVRGTAVNNDGAEKVGFTAPGVSGQVAVIRDALAVAGVPAADIGYVEAHGTGTALGDPIELRALSLAHAADGTPPDSCHLGSVKANLGHLDAAAGVTGLIKALLVLRDQVIPVQPSFTSPNPALAQYLSRYRVPRHTVAATEPIRAASVSSFGIGGTNAHAVLVPPPADARPPAEGRYLVAVSARDDDALRTLVAGLRRHLTEHPEVRLDDLAYTCVAGRRRYAARAVFSAGSLAELAVRLDGYLSDGHCVDTATGPAARWVAGGDLGPDEVGDVTRARRVPLPGHPLRPTRHWAAPELPPAAVPAAPPRTDTDVVLRVAGRLLDTTELGPDDDLYDWGLDSLGLVDLVTSLRDETGLPVRYDDFDRLRTAAEMAGLLAGLSTMDDAGPEPAPVPTELPARYRHLMVKVREGTEDGHVFLVHPAGGTTMCYVDLARHVRDGRTMWALGYPGDEWESFPTIRSMASLYLDLVKQVQPSGPYVLGGYSMGGNIAFEMAVMLESAGEKVTRIVMLDSHPPEAYVGGVAGDEDYYAAIPALVSEILPGVTPPGGRPPVTLAEAVDAIRQPGWSDSYEAEMVRFVQLWRHHHQALKRWYPDATVNADVVVLAAGERENGVILERLGIRTVERSVWAAHVAGRLSVQLIDGDHYSMLRNPANLPGLAAAYDEALRTSQPTEPATGGFPA